MANESSHAPEDSGKTATPDRHSIRLVSQIGVLAGSPPGAEANTVGDLIQLMFDHPDNVGGIDKIEHFIRGAMHCASDDMEILYLAGTAAEGSGYSDLFTRAALRSQNRTLAALEIARRMREEPTDAAPTAEPEQSEIDDLRRKVGALTALVGAKAAHDAKAYERERADRRTKLAAAEQAAAAADSVVITTSDHEAAGEYIAEIRKAILDAMAAMQEDHPETLFEALALVASRIDCIELHIRPSETESEVQP